MLPHIAAQQGRLTKAERVHAVFGLGNLKAAIFVLHQPAPARTKLTSACGGEISLELINRAKTINQCLFQFRWHGRRTWSHHFPELHMVPMLACIVEDAVLGHSACLIGACDDFFNRFAFPFGACNQLIAIIDIGLVVQVVVEFQCLGRHPLCGKRIMGIGQVRKCKSHGFIPSSRGFNF